MHVTLHFLKYSVMCEIYDKGGLLKYLYLLFLLIDYKSESQINLNYIKDTLHIYILYQVIQRHVRPWPHKEKKFCLTYLLFSFWVLLF